MVTITLPPELEQAVAAKAQQQGTTPEIYLLNDLRERYLPSPEPEQPPVESQTMADFLQDFIGCVDSNATYPEGSRLSENTGRKFAELMVEKRRQGKL